MLNSKKNTEKIYGEVTKAWVKVDNLPLSAYRHFPFCSMRTEALDRFGIKLEKRFTRPEIGDMMKKAGLEDIVFRDDIPYWCAVGYKRNVQ